MRSNIPKNNNNSTNNSSSDSFYQQYNPSFDKLQQKKRFQQKPKQPLSSYESVWDDSESAIPRKANVDSIHTSTNHNNFSAQSFDSQVNNLNSKKSNSKLYTFYDYINKKNNNTNNNNEERLNLDNKSKNNANPYSRYSYNNNSNNNTSNNNNNNNSFEESNYNDIIELNTPVFEKKKFQTNKTVSPPLSPLSEPYYMTMPISSGFGGYTGTTRRKPQPKVRKTKINFKFFETCFDGNFFLHPFLSSPAFIQIFWKAIRYIFYSTGHI